MDDVAEIQEANLWWRAALHLREEFSDAIWNTCFADARSLSEANNVVVLGVPNSLVSERITSRYSKHIESLMSSLAGRPINIEVVVDNRLNPPAASDRPRSDSTLDPMESDDDEVEEAPAPVRRTRTAIVSALDSEPALDPRYTFEDFVTGQSNQFAKAAAQRVAEQPARSYNPLFIYGESGLGKTHLLQAIGHYVRQYHPGNRVRYVSTETFVNEFVDAIRGNTTPMFKRRYRDECDVLLIDDIQFIEGKEATQDEFFHTFNYLHMAGRQVVITSDRPPKAIATLEDRLRTRFEWGLTTDITPPELETRLAILRQKALNEHLDVPDEVLTFIATHFKENIRQLEGALNRVGAFAGLSRQPLTLPLAQQVLADLLSGNEPRPITAKLIMNSTADLFGFSIAELTGQSRRRPLVTARQVGMYVFRELTDYSYPMIGREFGGRDHTTVIHAVDKISQQMKLRRAIYDQVTQLIKEIRQGDGGKPRG